MSMLLDVDLAEFPPRKEYEKIDKDSIFVGSFIRNAYDEIRVSIESVNGIEPKRYCIKPFLNSNTINLYGFLFTPKGPDQFLVNTLKTSRSLDLISYNSILEEYNYTCTENFINLNQGVYPLDPVHINRYIPNYTFENFIQFNEEIAQFQQFTTINMLVLIP